MSSDESPVQSHHVPGGWRIAAAYATMLGLAVAAFIFIQGRGEQLQAVESPTATQSAASAAKTDALMHVLLALTAIILAGRWLGQLFRKIGQPRVIGEMVAGIMLGPSLLGRVWPEATQFILPSGIAPQLGIIAQIGVILYMFLVGLELNAAHLRDRAHSTVAISHASIVAPFLLGAGLALWLYGPYAPEGVPFTSFALFIGVAMAITAFPVLARILTDRGIDKTPLGVIALSCAAIDDVTAWCLLAFVVGITQAKIGGAVVTILLAIGYIGVMFGVVRPMVLRWLGTHDYLHPPRRVAVWVLIALLLSALAAEAIGVHAIFGAFLLGAVIPHESSVARDFRSKLEDIVRILLLPAFFAYTGMRTQIGLVSGLDEWLMCGAIILVATVGKFGGTFAAARLTGLDRNTSAALGVLMNTRGLMELVVLNIGLELGVITPELFAMMVIMALVTTMTTTPALALLTRSR